MLLYIVYVVLYFWFSMPISDCIFPYQNGVNKLANLVGVTLGPKGRNVVLESKYGPPRIVNDGVTVAKEVRVITVYSYHAILM